MKIWLRFLLIGVLLWTSGFGLASSALGAEDAEYVLVRSVFTAVGEPVSAGDYSLVGTLGEPIAGPAVGANSYWLGGGFWADEVTVHNTYLPLVRK